MWSAICRHSPLQRADNAGGSLVVSELFLVYFKGKVYRTNREKDNKTQVSLQLYNMLRILLYGKLQGRDSVPKG
jgi:hypothetical protein